MPNPMIAMMGLSAGSSILGANSQRQAAGDASDSQLRATQLGIDEQKRQFDIQTQRYDALQKLYQPYIGAGSKALGGMLDLNGLNGSGAQQTAIEGISGSPQFAALRDQGFNAINQNAAATGGLRGGNTQAALGQFAPNMLQGLIQQQYAQLGGLTNLGQNSIAGQGQAVANQGAAGQNYANNATSLYGQQGAAQAGNYLAQGQAQSDMWGGIGGSLGYGLGRSMIPEGEKGALPGPLFERWKF